MRAVVAIAAAIALTNCSGGGDPPPPAPDAYACLDEIANAPTCWPEAPRIAQGSAVLGTGRGAFETMPELLKLEYGAQDGYNLVAHVRMSGFPPGNAADILDPANPRTRIRAFFADTNVPLAKMAFCPGRYPYVESPTGDYELAQGIGVIFDTCWRSDHLFGKRIRIELELLDCTGGYATDTKIVTAAPPDFYPPDQGTPGCQ